MKGVIILVFIVLLGIFAWSASNCNNQIPGLDKFSSNGALGYTSKFCICPQGLQKIMGVNGTQKCVIPHNDSMTSCKAYDHCTAPEQCVRLNQTDFACKSVQAGCFEFIDIDGTVKQKCI